MKNKKCTYVIWFGQYLDSSSMINDRGVTVAKAEMLTEEHSALDEGFLVACSSSAIHPHTRRKMSWFASGYYLQNCESLSCGVFFIPRLSHSIKALTICVRRKDKWKTKKRQKGKLCDNMSPLDIELSSHFREMLGGNKQNETSGGSDTFSTRKYTRCIEDFCCLRPADWLPPCLCTSARPDGPWNIKLEASCDCTTDTVVMVA